MFFVLCLCFQSSSLLHQNGNASDANHCPPRTADFLKETDPALPHRLESLDKPDTWSEPRSLILLQSCSTRKANHTVATPGIGCPKGCLLLPVALPTSICISHPIHLPSPSQSCSWKLLAHPTPDHAPQLLGFLGLGKEMELQRSKETEPQCPAGGYPVQPNRRWSRPLREALPEAETKMPSLLFVFPRARTGR